MRCIQGRAPFWKSDERAHSIKVDLLVCCAVLLIPQVVRFGARPLLLVLATGAIGALTEIGCCLILHREIRLGDWDSVTIGVLIAMLMPANIALAVPAVATVFAIAIAKMPFGGTGNTPMHPVAAGVAFVTLCFPDAVFAYADVLSGKMDLNIFRTAAVIGAQSPTALLKTGARPELLKPELMVGSIVGAIGTTVTVLTAAAAFYLFCRKSASARISVCWMLAAAVIAGLFPRVSTGRLDSVMIELSTGSLVFFAAMIAPDPTTAPKLPLAQCLYGFLGGILTMLFRFDGAFEQNACFAVLLINAVSPTVDRCVWRGLQWGRRHGYGLETHHAE